MYIMILLKVYSFNQLILFFKPKLYACFVIIILILLNVFPLFNKYLVLAVYAFFLFYIALIFVLFFVCLFGFSLINDVRDECTDLYVLIYSLQEAFVDIMKSFCRWVCLM